MNSSGLDDTVVCIEIPKDSEGKRHKSVLHRVEPTSYCSELPGETHTGVLVTL